MASSRISEPRPVELTNVAKHYGSLVAVAPVSLSIARGEAVALLGPSGGGKTTLLSMMVGEMEPSAGVIRLNGRELAEMRPGPELARQVGLIHQQFDLVPNLSALHNVLAGRLGEWGLVRSLVSLLWPQDRELGMAALRRVGVGDRASLHAGRLSGGEQQRVAIARLLVQDPQVLLADEPVSSLDPARAEEVLHLLVDATKDGSKTLVASVHTVDLARRFFSRLIGVRNGEVQFDLPVEQVTRSMFDSLYDTKGLSSETVGY